MALSARLSLSQFYSFLKHVTCTLENLQQSHRAVLIHHRKQGCGESTFHILGTALVTDAPNHGRTQRAAHFKLIIPNLINYSHSLRLDSQHTRRVVQGPTLKASLCRLLSDKFRSNIFDVRKQHIKASVTAAIKHKHSPSNSPHILQPFKYSS